MANFVQLGRRVVNLEHVVAAERDGTGPVTVYLAAGQGPWTFDDQHEADVLWLKLVPTRGDLADLAGGPYSITDNEQTASREDR
jgi:hypothetical protein